MLWKSGLWLQSVSELGVGKAAVPKFLTWNCSLDQLICRLKLFVIILVGYNFCRFFFIKTTKVSLFQPTKIITDKVYHCSIHSGNKFSHSYRNLLRQLCNQTHQVRITWHYKTASRGLVSQSSKHSYIPVIYTSIHDDDYQLRGPLGLSY